MTILNTEQSAKAYNLLKPFFPEYEIDNVLELSSTIIGNIIEADEHEKFLHIAMLLTGKKLEELLSIDMNDFALILIESLVDNRIVELMELYKVGFNG